MKTYYVTVQGCESKLRERMQDGDELVVLHPQRPLQLQLLAIPDGNVQVMASPPASWPKEEKERFAIRVSECYMGLCITRNTINKRHLLWEENAFYNHERILQAKTVEQLDHAKHPALICGNGPSLDTDWFNGIIYTCWHAAPRLPRADYICHIDAIGFEHRRSLKPDRGIIATPTVSRNFLEAYPQTPLFAYLSDSNLIDARFLDRLNHFGHPNICGTVVDMMVSAAIIAGHKEIYLSGVDLSFPTEEQAKAYAPAQPVMEFINNKGETVYGDPAYDVFRKALESHADRYPQVKFYQTSENGLALEGYTFINTKERTCLT